MPQIFLHGDSLHSMTVAVVVPNPDAVRGWARDNSRDGTMTDLCNDPQLREVIMRDMVAKGKASGLQGFEIPRAIHLEPEPWTPADLLTPSLKLKRADAAKRYRGVIDSMYDVLEPGARAHAGAGAMTAVRKGGS